MTDDLDFCRSLIRTADEDLFLSLGYAPQDDRPRLAALFALQIELRRIPSLVSEPALGEIRLQWWREALDQIASGKKAHAHPVIDALNSAGAIGLKSREVAERLVDARARLLYDPEFSSLGDLESFLRNAEAPLALLASIEGEAKNADVLSKLGEAYALTRFAPKLAPRFAREAAEKGMRLFNELAGFLNSLLPADAGRVAYLGLTRGYAAHEGGSAWPLAKRIALFRAMLTGKF